MSSSSREYSPDWLRNVQAPLTTSILTLSSSSVSIPGSTPVSEDEKDDDEFPIKFVIKKTSEVKSPSKKPSRKRNTLGESEGSKTDGKVAKGIPQKPTKPQEPKISVWALSSDSEHELSEKKKGQHPKEENKDDDILDTIAESSIKGSSILKSPKKRLKVEDMSPTKTKRKGPKKTR